MSPKYRAWIAIGIGLLVGLIVKQVRIGLIVGIALGLLLITFKGYKS